MIFPEAVIPSGGFWTGSPYFGQHSSIRDSLGNHISYVFGNYSFNLSSEGGDSLFLGGPTYSISK